MKVPYQTSVILRYRSYNPVVCVYVCVYVYVCVCVCVYIYIYIYIYMYVCMYLQAIGWWKHKKEAL